MSVINKALVKLKRDGFRTTLFAVLRKPLRVKQRFAYQKMLTLETIGERFNEIYEENLWSSLESGSGEGSEVEYTEPLRNWLVRVIPEYQIRKLVDAPCGDFNWMRLVLPELDVEYYGCDIVQSVISKNTGRYGAKNLNFEVMNICRDKLPNCDLLVVRDCLFHLSYEDINKFLINIANVDYKYLLTTTNIVVESFSNKNITSGDSRLIDLFSEPFGFREDSIIERVSDFPKGHSFPREMVLIAKANVPKNIVTMCN